MTNKEIKPSFSLKYLLLTALTAVIVGGVGFGLSKLYESRAKQELTVANGYSIDVIGENALPRDKFEVEYYLKGKKRQKISSLFRKQVIIKNSGNVGISDLKVTVILKNKDVTLIDYPKIESNPQNIVDALLITKGENSTDKIHYWTISLLNPGESISFDYSMFSEKKLNSITLEVIPRKKDVKINNQELSFATKPSVTDVIVSSTSILFLTLVLIYAIAFPFYYFQWSRRDDYRKKYISFFKFFNDHRPGDLFKAPENVE